MEIKQAQLEQIANAKFRERLDRSLQRTLQEYRRAGTGLRSDFLELSIDAARGAGLHTEQGIASYALGAWYFEPGFESRSRLLAALLASTLPELRKVHALNDWVHAAIGNPADVAGADDNLRRAFERTHAWAS